MIAAFDAGFDLADVFIKFADLMAADFGEIAYWKDCKKNMKNATDHVLLVCQVFNRLVGRKTIW